MKKCFTLWAVLLLCCSLPVAAANIPVTIYADAGYPPYSYDKDGKAAGLYHEIVAAALARMQGYKVDIKPVPWKRGMDMLRSGTGFALYPPYMNTKDEPWTWPYSQPLFEEHVVAYCRKDVIDAKPRKRWPEDFYGLTIGNNAGFIVGGEAFDAAVKAGRLRIEEDVAGELDVMLELPTGAPLRNTQHLDLLQAQIYAEDLSKLMARSRKRSST